MGEYFLGGVDLLGLFLALVAVSMAVRLVLRTEKDLDKAAKFLLADAAVLVVANFATVNNYFGGFISENASQIIFHSSRILALSCFISAMYYLTKITEKK